ncbi:MAG TPA: helix-turn-helix domain-containing protein [Chloroflexota bacterium]|jgi:excisionase family DNA binding protein
MTGLDSSRTAQPVERQTLTVEETARVLGISRTSAYAAAKRGELPTVRIGRRYVVPRAALERLLSQTGGTSAAYR